MPFATCLARHYSSSERPMIQCPLILLFLIHSRLAPLASLLCPSVSWAHALRAFHLLSFLPTVLSPAVSGAHLVTSFPLKFQKPLLGTHYVLPLLYFFHSNDHLVHCAFCVFMCLPSVECKLPWGQGFLSFFPGVPRLVVPHTQKAFSMYLLNVEGRLISWLCRTASLSEMYSVLPEVMKFIAPSSASACAIRTLLWKPEAQCVN